MAFDAHANLALAPVLVPPSPALSGTSLIIAGGYAALFPAVPFNATVYPGGVTPTAANAEIVRVTNIVGDVFTITRAQEGTTAKAIASGWSIANTITVKVITDIENAISSGGSGIQSISAGTLAITNSEVIFSNSNGVSFGASSNVITASFSGGGGGGAAISAGANSQNTGTIQFSNSNGVTFGLSNNGVLTASHDGITSQSVQPVAASASNGSFAFSTLAFSDANGVTFGTSAGGIITASVGTAAAGNSVNFSAGTESANLGSIVFSNSNGVSFGLDAGTVTAQHNGLTSQSNQAASASNGSFTFQTLAFSNANNVTFGTSAGGIVTASVNAGGGGSINFSAGTQSADLASIVFSNSNGVSFGLSNGTITASASGGAAGNAFTASIFEAPVPLGNNTTLQTYPSNRIVFDQFNLPFNLSFNKIQGIFSGSVSFTPASVSTTSTGSLGITHDYVIYSRSVTDSGATNFSNSSIIVSHISQSWTMQALTTGSSSSKTVNYFWMTDSTGGSSSSSQSTNAANMAVDGMSQRIIVGVPFANSLSAGEYWIGRRFNSEQTNNGGSLMLTSVYEMSWQGNSTNNSSFGDTGNGNVNGNNLFLPGQGFFSTSSSAMPPQVNLIDDIRNSNLGNNQGRRYYVFKA
jgi:hypothetical protein